MYKWGDFYIIGMARKGYDKYGRPTRAQRIADQIDRRRFMAYATGGAAVGLAGCLGDDEVDPDDDDDVDDMDDVDDTDDVDDVDDDPEEIERWDVQVWEDRRPPAPPDSQYQSYSGINRTTWDGMMQYELLSRSWGDMQMYPEIAEGWDYQPGLITVDLHEDFWYFDDGVIDAENIMMHWELQNYHWGGDDLHSNDNVVRAEQTDDYQIRFNLIDTWRESWALEQSIADWNPQGSGLYYQEWLDRFLDAPDLDAIEDIREELGDETHPSPDPFYYNAFRVVDAIEDRWILRLRVGEEHPETGVSPPHYVSDINFLEKHIVTNEEDARTREMFRAGAVPYDGLSHWDGDEDELPFEVRHLPGVCRAISGWGVLFNCSRPPMSNTRFRRAIQYATDKDTWTPSPYSRHDDRGSPFFTPEREENFVSSDIVEALDTFDPEEANLDQARTELELGGFEWDGDGRLLWMEGDRAGEPQEYTFYTYAWEGGIAENGTDWVSAMDELGITFDGFISDEAHWGRIHSDGDFDIGSGYWGGGDPVQVMAGNFGDSAIWGMAYPRLGETVDAPPIGENWRDDPDVELETYDTRAMADRLAVTQDDAAFQELVDTLTWVWNQVVPRFGVSQCDPNVGGSYLNADRFDMADQYDRPDLWTKSPWRRAWNTGNLQYVGGEEWAEIDL